MQGMLIEKERHFNEISERYGSNSRTGVIICSGERESKGKIEQCNFEIENVLGYKVENLKGESLNLLIPSEMIKKKHNQFIQKYLMNPEEIQNEKITLAQRRDGYILPVHILRSMIPTITQGVKLISFLTPSKYIDSLSFNHSDSFILADTTPLFIIDKNMKIHGFTKAINKFCAINEDEYLTPNNNQEKEGGSKIYDFKTLYPKIFMEENEFDMRMEGFVFKSFDISPLRNILLLEMFNSPSEYENDQISKLSNLKSEVLIKIKETKIDVTSGSPLRFGVLTIQVIEELGDTTEEVKSISDELIKINEKFDYNEQSSCASMASSIYIYIYIYIVASLSHHQEMQFFKEFKINVTENKQAKSFKLLSRFLIIMFIVLLGFSCRFIIYIYIYNCNI